jgi:hypothetical protein
MLATLGFIWVLGASVYLLFGFYAVMTAPPQRHDFFTAWSFAALLFMAALWPLTRSHDPHLRKVTHDYF